MLLLETKVLSLRTPTCSLAKIPLNCRFSSLNASISFTLNRSGTLLKASFLRDTAAKWWMPIFSVYPPPSILDNWEEFTNELFNMFGNKHLQTTAQNEIIRMKMKDNARVTEYLVDFNSHAAYTGWNDVALAGHFYQGLPDRLKDMFQYIQKPQNFVEMRQHALNFDQRYWERQEELGKKPANVEKSKEKKSGDKAADGKDNKSAGNPSNEEKKGESSKSRNSKGRGKGQNSQGDAKTNNPSSSSSTPANTDQPKSQVRPPLTQEEKDRRRREGLCFYCGDSGHTASHHNNPKGKKPAASSNPTGRAVITLTTNDKPTDSENQSPAQTSTEAS